MPRTVHDMETLMTTREAAAYLRISTDYLAKLAGAGLVPARKVGRRWRFDPATLATLGILEQPTRIQLSLVAPNMLASEPMAVPAKRARAPRKARTETAAERIRALDPYADLLTAN